MIALEGFGDGRNEDHTCRQIPDRLGGVVKTGEDPGYTGKQCRKDHTGHEGKGHEFPVFAAYFPLRTAGTQHLAHENAYGVADGGAGNGGHVVDGIDDV